MLGQEPSAELEHFVNTGSLILCQQRHGADRSSACLECKTDARTVLASSKVVAGWQRDHRELEELRSRLRAAQEVHVCAKHEEPVIACTYCLAGFGERTDQAEALISELLDAVRVAAIGLKDHDPCEGRDNNDPCTLCWIEGTAQAALKKYEVSQ